MDCAFRCVPSVSRQMLAEQVLEASHHQIGRLSITARLLGGLADGPRGALALLIACPSSATPVWSSPRRVLKLCSVS